MSFLGSGRSSTPAGGVNSDKIDIAITEYAWRFSKSYAWTQFSTDWTLTPTFSIVWSCGSKHREEDRIISQLGYRSCHNKCIGTRYAEGDLNKGESVCIDRCVIKFSETQKKVQDKLQARAQANANPGGGASGFSVF